MAWIDELLELLNTLILSIDDNTVTTDKETLESILSYLQLSQDKVALLKLDFFMMNLNERIFEILK